MWTKRKTMIVTGAAKGIGAGVTNAFIERGYNAVANSTENGGISIFQISGGSGMRSPLYLEFGSSLSTLRTEGERIAENPGR
jgi:hypothetical protein